MKIWLFIICLLYAISPYDLMPERGLGRIGLIDDVMILGALYWYFIYRPARSAAKRRIPEDNEEREEEGEKEAAEGAEFREPPQSSAGMDPYGVLGVARDATDEEIKHAYRELANKYHPDKVSHLGDEFKKIAEKKFKEIQAAYGELTRK